MSRKTKALEFTGETYKIHVTGRHVNVTDAMKQYAVDHISKIERFSPHIIDVVVTMDIQKLEHRVDIVLKVDHLKIKGSAASTDMYVSIDMAIDRIDRQLRRYKKRIQDHQARSIGYIDLNVNVLRPHRDDNLHDVNDAIEEENKRQLLDVYKPHEIVTQKTLSVRSLTLDEAIMKMELSGDAFLIFRDEKNLKPMIIYRCRDDNYGLFELSL